MVSYGVGCGRSLYPGVYTRVDRYVGWIMGQLEEIMDKKMGVELLAHSSQDNEDFMDKVDFTDLLQPFFSALSSSIHPVCTGSSKVLSCKSSNLVRITQAFFGRHHGGECPVPWLPAEAEFS